MRFEKRCACGDSTNSFRVDIGPFFVASCCEEKGYDSLGNPPKKMQESASKEETKETLTKEAVSSVVKTIDAINKAIKKPKKSKKKKDEPESQGS
jgi:hypothetical protein